jgi:hypothetical protein
VRRRIAILAGIWLTNAGFGVGCERISGRKRAPRSSFS